MKKKRIILFFLLIIFCVSCAYTPGFQKTLLEKDAEIQKITVLADNRKIELEKLKSDIEKSEELNQNLKKIIEELKEEKTPLTENLRLVEKQNLLLKEEVINAQKNNSQLQNFNSELSDKIKRLETQLAQNQELIANLNNELSAKVEKIKEQENIENSLNIEITNLKNTVAARQNEIEQLNNRIIQLQKNIEERIANENIKYNNLLEETEKIKKEFKNNEETNIKLKTINDSLTLRVNSLLAELAQKQEEYQGLANTAEKQAAEKVQSELEELKNDNNTLSHENNKLKEEIARLRIIEKNTELINREYNAIKIKLEELTKLVGLDKIEELKKLENENAAIIEELEKLKLNVLNLTHQEKEIKIIIYEKDLYQPNKMLLNNGGIEILKKLSEIFNKYTSRKILISGHSDNIATNNPKYPTNWELSSARASVIARTLINNFKVSANRITVQGLADTKPIASNSTADGRSKNRRIEIIISSY